eukprot:8797921-Pyramimonas_sp.AAC.1
MSGLKMEAHSEGGSRVAGDNAVPRDPDYIIPRWADPKGQLNRREYANTFYRVGQNLVLRPPHPRREVPAPPPAPAREAAASHPPILPPPRRKLA